MFVPHHAASGWEKGLRAMSHSPVGGNPQGWDHKLADRSSLPPVPGEERAKPLSSHLLNENPSTLPRHGAKGGCQHGEGEGCYCAGPEGASACGGARSPSAPRPGSGPGPGSNVPPPYVRWAKTLHDLLEDVEGSKLFQSFVRSAGGLHSDRLTFYFAVRGLKEQTDPDKIRPVISVIYRFLRKSQLTTPEHVRQKIKQCLKEDDAAQIDTTIFDGMVQEVERWIMTTTYPNFLQSDEFLQHVSSQPSHQHALSSPDSCSSTASSPSSGKDVCLSNIASALPTLHEDEELATSGAPGPGPLTPQRLTKDLLIATQNRRLQPESFAGSVFGRKYSVYSHPPLSYSYCPVSRQDSELQSLSSGRASDTRSMSGSSVDGLSLGRAERSSSSRMLRGLHKNTIINKDTGTQAMIPRTFLMQKEQFSIMKPDEFAPLLIEKLEKVKRDRDNQEKLERKLMEVRSDMEDGMTQAIPPQLVAAAIREKLQVEDDNDQDILDQHVSRVWSDLTPSGCSPGLASSPRRSPPRRRRAPHDLASTVSADSGHYDSSTLDAHAQAASAHALPKSRSVPDYAPGPYARQPMARRSLSKKTLTDSGVSVVSEGAGAAPSVPAEPRSIITWLQESCERYNRRSYLGSRASSAERSSGSRREREREADLPVTAQDDPRRRAPRSSRPAHLGTTPAPSTVVMFTFLDEQVPYRTKIPSSPVTLRQFKDYLPRKGNYRYFFKTQCDDLGSSMAIQEEISSDTDVLPLFEGKVMARVKNVE